MEKVGFQAVMEGADDYVEKVEKMAAATDLLANALEKLEGVASRLGPLLNLTINVGMTDPRRERRD